jgi:ABC-type transport system involved in multi-copper enzyme maturation permease subunit
MLDVLAAEWWKLRSVRSTYAVLAVTAAFTGIVVLLAFQMAHVWDGLDADRRDDLLLRPLQEMASWVASLSLGVLGVLSATSEYRTGMIRTSITAVPRRTTLLAAKAAVVAVVAAVAGQAAAVGAFLGTRAVIGDRPFADQRAPIAQDLPDIVLAGTVVPVFALLGLAFGVLLRSAAGAIVALVFVWHMLPVLVQHLPGPWGERAGSVMLAGLPRQMAGLSAENSIYGDLLSPGQAAAVLAGYALVPLALAAFVLTRRDA